MPASGPLSDIILADSNYEHVTVVFCRKIPLAMRGNISIVKMTKELIQFFFYLKTLIKAHNLKLAYVNTLSCLPALVVLKWLKVARIVHVHEMLENDRFLTRMMNRYALKWSSEIICVSAAVKQNLLASTGKNYSDKIKVVRNGVKSFYEKTVKKSSGIVVAYFGRIKPEKGVWFFLDAIEQLSGEVKANCTFKIYGSTPPGKSHYYTNLLDDVKSHKYHDAISVTTFVADIKQYLNESDIVVVPSLGYDSFPTIILEALSAGKPVIATNTGGAVESVIDNQNGYIISPNDTVDFSAKLSKLISDDELRKQMGDKARERYLNEFKVEDFTNRLATNLKSFIAQANKF